MLFYPDVSAAASVTIATLRQIGVTSCFVGGMACKLYGNDRTPEVCLLRQGCCTTRSGPRLLRSLYQGSRYPMSRVSMGSGGIETTSRRSQPFILPRRRQNARCNIPGSMVPQLLRPQVQSRPPVPRNHGHSSCPDRRHR